MVCFKIVAGMVPVVDDFFEFKFKTSFLTVSTETNAKWKSSSFISEKVSFILLMLICFS